MLSLKIKTMDQELKTLIVETLKEFETIKFDFSYVSKGCDVEIGIGEKRNEECGPIYELLHKWLGYDGFVHFMLNRNVISSFDGFIELIGDEIFFMIEVYGTEYGHIEINEQLIIEELGIDIHALGLEEFDPDGFNVNFERLENLPYNRLVMSYYKDDWQILHLDDNQQSVLTDFLDTEIDNSYPYLSFDFDCEVDCDIECIDNNLEFNYRSTPIKINLDSII
jgi:hypothetical protein